MSRLPFGQLQIWQKSMLLAKEIYRITSSFPRTEIYGLTSQMRRCAVSIPSNIAEGSQRVSDKDFANFILIAKGSLAELHTQLLLSFEFQYISQNENDQLILKVQEIDKMIRSFHQKLTA